jgi:transcriptional regulator with XRE-family HTH domain
VKSDQIKQKTIFADFIKELLNSKNLSFRKTAKIAQELGFEISPSAIYKAIHNSKKSPLKPMYIRMFATIFNMDRSEIVEKILDDKYADYFFEDIKSYQEVLSQALKFVKEGNIDEARYFISKYIAFLKEFKEDKVWKDTEYDLNMKFISSLKDMGRHRVALEQCRTLLNSGDYNVNSENKNDLLRTIDILHMMTCLLYRLKRNSEFEIYYKAGVMLAEKKLKDIFQKLRFDGVKANFLHDNKLYDEAVAYNTEIVNALRKYSNRFQKDQNLSRKYLCNISSALTNLGWCLIDAARNEEEMKEGLEYIEEGYQTIQKTDHRKLLAHIIFYLARGNYALGDYERARSLFFKSKKIAEEDQFLDLMAFNLWGLSMTYEALDEHKSAEQYLFLARSQIKKVEEDTNEKRKMEEYLEAKGKGV